MRACKSPWYSSGMLTSQYVLPFCDIVFRSWGGVQKKGCGLGGERVSILDWALKSQAKDLMKKRQTQHKKGSESLVHGWLERVV